MSTGRGPVLIAHPSADLYGSDLQLLETVTGLVEADGAPTVVLPASGPLVARLLERGAEVVVLDTPVLRKNLMTPRGLVRLLVDSIRALPRQLALLRDRPGAPVLVNTVTVPLWILAGRLARRRTVVHVHEAEESGHRLVRSALALPQLLATAVIANSAAARSALTEVVPAIGARTTVVHNGFPGPELEPEPPRDRNPGDPIELVLVGRLSPRKGIDVALEAVSLLLGRGRQVGLDVYGSIFPGYEWYESELRERIEQPDLAGRVRLGGYRSPTWPALAEADVVLVPSRVEPFGNTAVEGLLAARPVVASRTQGLVEIIRDGGNGLLAEPDDPTALAEAIDRLVLDPVLAARLATDGRRDALQRFSPERYRRAMTTAIWPEVS